MDYEDDMLRMWEDDTPFLQLDIPSTSVETCNDGFQDSNSKETFYKQMDEDLDYAFALSLQTQYEEEGKENIDSSSKTSKPYSKESKPLSIVDEQWELLDPHPDINALFLEYDKNFFYGKLKSVEVKWSPRMTLCAGVCSYEGRGGLCSVRLSVPLLKLRPRKDLVETLLHEMIHAYLFVTHNNKDREGHGPEFLKHMNRINKESGTRITVYHSFHNEVDLYRKHWWKCDGPCQKKRPFYGLVKRAMNRAPGPNDNWWNDHQASCGGKFTKIREPNNYKKKKATKRKLPVSESKGSPSDIRSFLKDDISACGSRDNSNSIVKPSNIFDIKSILSKEENVADVNHANVPAKKNFIPFQGTGVKLGTSSDAALVSNLGSLHKKRNLPLLSTSEVEVLDITDTKTFQKQISKSCIDRHLLKGQPSSSISNNVSKKFIQSPIENFLTSKITDNNKEIHVETIDISEVPCPVCFLPVCEVDINTHLDHCLNK